jgi:IS605 OrfB family transposase
MKLRPLVEHFQSEAGATRGSRSRWLKWLNFLRSTPEIVCWRDPKAEYEPLTDAEVKKVRQSRRRAVSRERDLVFAKNPTLAEFDRSHGLYEREFARTYAKRRHSDGFRQRPTFTLPSLPTRPDWPRFQQAQGWQKLDLIAKSLELRLLDEDGGNSWINLRMVPDPRIASITRLDEAVKIRRVKYEYKWRGKCSETTLIQPQGAKLICKPSGMFLSISFDIQPPPCLIPYDQAAVTKYGFRSTLRKTRESAPDSTLITCAVDLAIRHLGALSIAREGEVFARRILKNRTSLPGTDTCVNIPALADIAQLKRRLRTARRKSGKISPNKHSCRRLQEHYRNMQADRYKKAAAVICQYARLHGAQVLIFEDLKRLVPDTANERGVNNALASWNQGSIIDSAKKTAEDFGLRVVTVPAYYTSRLCARCNAVGVRYDQGRKRPFRTPRRVFHVSESHRRAVEITALGHWFYCPNCQRRVHADLNASENLHKVFLGTFPYAKRDGRDFIVVDDKRLDLRETRIEAERQLKIATFGKLPF